ncbi:MAG: exodeoxyribonuclease VII small subunit [Christensenellales bacterium]|jgi:exodeoxyribonuclease VII small subunit
MTQQYEASLARLQEIAQKLEQGGLSLEQSLKLFEEGVALYASCAKALTAAEGRLRALSKQAGLSFDADAAPEDEA